MAKSLLIVFVLSVLGPTLFSTNAIAGHWVKTTPNSTGMTTMYDAESVYLESATGLVYVTTCDDDACVARAPGALFGPTQARVDCAARSISYLGKRGWGAPAHEGKEYSTNDNEYQPETSAAMTVEAMCSQKDSWPSR